MRPTKIPRTTPGWPWFGLVPEPKPEVRVGGDAEETFVAVVSFVPVVLGGSQLKGMLCASSVNKYICIICVVACVMK